MGMKSKHWLSLIQCCVAAAVFMIGGAVAATDGQSGASRSPLPESSALLGRDGLAASGIAATPRSASGTEKSAPDEDPLEAYKKAAFRVFNGLPWWARVLIGIVVGGGVILWYWKDIRTALGNLVAAWLAIRGGRAIPKATGERYAVCLAKLENDPEGVNRRLIRDALVQEFAAGDVQVLSVDRAITVGEGDFPQEDVLEGHGRARGLLVDANADVMIWGEALNAAVGGLLRLHVTLNDKIVKPASMKIRPDETTYDLPEEFWDVLRDFLALLIYTQGVALTSNPGAPVSAAIEPYIARVRALHQRKPISAPDIAIIFANALSMYGEQRNEPVLQREALRVLEGVRNSGGVTGLARAKVLAREAVALFSIGTREAGTATLERARGACNEALASFRADLMPDRWGSAKITLGNVLRVLGERETGLLRLQQAVAAYREVLPFRRREHAARSWALLQSNLGVALALLGARSDRPELLLEAIAAFRAALEVYDTVRSEVPFDWARYAAQSRERAEAARRPDDGRHKSTRRAWCVRQCT